VTPSFGEKRLDWKEARIGPCRIFQECVKLSRLGEFTVVSKAPARKNMKSNSADAFDQLSTAH